MIIGAGQQFPRNNSHCVFQLQNGNGTTFTDTSTGHTATHTVTAYNSPSGWAAATPPTGINPFKTAFHHSGNKNEYYTIPNTDDFKLPSVEQFTMELWYKQNEILTMNRSGFIIGNFLLSPAPNSYIVMRTSKTSGSVYFFVGFNIKIDGTLVYENNTTLTEDTNWHHYAICRNGSNIRAFRDGIVIASKTVSGIATSGYADNFYIASLNPGDNERTTSISSEYANIRIHKGIALYTRNFTPPNRAS